MKEICREGHEDLGREHLDYIKEMANRVGFSVLCPRPDVAPTAHEIKINIAMRDDVFVALLDTGREG